MDNWREKILHGDIAEAARRAGVSAKWYRDSLKIAIEYWEPRHIKINAALKEVVEEREQTRAVFLAEREARQRQGNDVH